MTRGGISETEARSGALALARREVALAKIAAHLRKDGLRALLFKGWAAAQFYDRPERRAMGDIDLCAAEGEFDTLRRVLQQLGPASLPGAPVSADRTVVLHISAGASHRSVSIDVHQDLEKYRLALREVFERAKEIHLRDGSTLLTPCAEHHLKISAMSFLNDGGVRLRPLEDIVEIIASRGQTLDWDLVLGETPRVRHWIASAIRLAERIVRPGIGDALPESVRSCALPNWLQRTAELEIAKPAEAHLPRPRFSMTLRRWPHHALREIAARWPNPIKASVELERDFDDTPRFPIQLAHFLRGAAHYVSRLLWR